MKTPSATNGVPVSVAMLSQFTRRCPDYNLCNLKAALEASLEIQTSASFETIQSQTGQKASMCQQYHRTNYN